MDAISPQDPRWFKPVPGLDIGKKLGKRACKQLQQHALDAYPHECIGYIKDKKYVPLENQSKTPETSAFLDAVAMAKLLALDPDLICHSHPNGPDCPSAGDMVFQRDTDKPCMVLSTDGQGALPPFVFGEGLMRLPLMKRAFRHGVYDCYSAAFDFYKVFLGIEVPDFPRDWEWWEKDNMKEGSEGLYIDHFKEMGFEQVQGDLQVGDVFLMRAGARVPNHAGVYIGGHLMYHHLAARKEFDHTRLATIEPVIRWQQHQRLDQVIRYKGL